ncbi:MAG: NADP-dependent malic enzyme [Paracidovorax wautersii]|uniref:NADP-dependent malic enzyme n=1 Tax=Paracidovorax wautersii TaxID=1177982 RepID=A0A7V8JS39_9BURK|nr:MAG: NADP-dependent malic enzyme [Paracidovorax wautersii]
MSKQLSPAEQALREAALEYHRTPVRGKIAVMPTKPLSNQRDLSLAYSPGVAYPCLDIQADPSLAAEYTSRGNLVGVITNGTAVLGLGDIGPLAGKPVMEGKGCLFKKFAGVDVFDIELAERDPDKLVEIIASLEPTLGGINLEDIKAPECFYIEKELSKRMNIPVFHDDQHGTAIISSAALVNGLELVGKAIGEVKVAVSGAGAAAIACLDVMVGLGVQRKNVYVVDSKGVIYEGRGPLDESKARYSQNTEARTLADVVKGADVFLGCSAAGVLTVEMVKTMADKPIIPTPFDSRLILRIAPAVAAAAAASGVATRPIADIEAYRASLTRFVYQTGMFMRPVFDTAKKRVAYAEGEDERVLRAAQVAVDEQLAEPILIGRPAVIEARIKKAGLRLSPGRDVQIVDPEDDPRFRQYWEAYHALMGREGVSPEAAKAAVRRSNTLIAALMVRLGDADALLCGLVGRYDGHLEHVRNVIGLKPGVPELAALNALTLTNHTLFIADTYINEEPDAELLAGIAKMAADEVQRFGLPAKVAFLSHSNYGSSKRKSALKMRQAHDRFKAIAPEVESDAALSETIRANALKDSTLTGAANVLICPNLDAANILFNVIKTTSGQGVTIGPILLGAAASAHVLTPSATVRRLVNMTALAVADANANNA